MQRYQLKLASYGEWISWTNRLWLFWCYKYNCNKFVN